MIKSLKGDVFVNRYRFTGTLTTKSPLHIGSGESSPKTSTSPEVSLVMKDHRGKPIIPGSTLRGVMRHWLFSILVAGFGDEWAKLRDYRDASLTNLSQTEQINKIKDDFSWLELLWGTPFHEGKVEVWDALCKTSTLPSTDMLLKWNQNSLTYIDTSVVINPATGTAVEDLLYNAEVVPPGVEFGFSLVGQNLSEFEIGLILLALQGFNSKIYPILVGARNGRGYGQMEYKPGQIYGLKADQLKDWIASTVKSYGATAGAHDGGPGDAAGYYALPELSDANQKHLIDNAKKLLTGRAEE